MCTPWLAIANRMVTPAKIHRLVHSDERWKPVSVHVSSHTSHHTLPFDETTQCCILENCNLKYGMHPQMCNKIRIRFIKNWGFVTRTVFPSNHKFTITIIYPIVLNYKINKKCFVCLFVCFLFIYLFIFYV